MQRTHILQRTPLTSATTRAVQRFGELPRLGYMTLITPAELAEKIWSGGKTTILATHWYPEEGASLAAYQSHHIPTALFCDTTAALASVPGGGRGRNPLPDAVQLQRSFRHWGLDFDHEVIVYDDGKGIFAARAWWILRWAGIPDVKILDGGLPAWEAAGHELVGGPGNLHGHCTYKVNIGQMPVAEMEEVQNFQGKLVDVREPNRFAGRKEHLDLKAGHIPGAINVPTRELMDEQNRFLSPEAIRERLAREGITSTDDIIVYSGSGLHSSLAVAALDIAGMPNAKMYAAGWSQWASVPSNPVEHGD